MDIGQADVLLSDEFQVLASNLKAVQEQKKTRTAEFKKLYEEYKKEMETLDAQAKNLYEDFQKSPVKATAVESEKKADAGPKEKDGKTK